MLIPPPHSKWITWSQSRCMSLPLRWNRYEHKMFCSVEILMHNLINSLNWAALRASTLHFFMLVTYVLDTAIVAFWFSVLFYVSTYRTMVGCSCWASSTFDLRLILPLQSSCFPLLKTRNLLQSTREYFTRLQFLVYCVLHALWLALALHDHIFMLSLIQSFLFHSNWRRSRICLCWDVR